MTLKLCQSSMVCDTGVDLAQLQSESQPGSAAKAGIDIGNESHYVAVPPSRHNQPVWCFGCTTAELKAMADWLKGLPLPSRPWRPSWPLGLPHAPLRDAVRRQRSGDLPGAAPAVTDQAAQVESRKPGIPTHRSSSGLKSTSFWGGMSLWPLNGGVSTSQNLMRIRARSPIWAAAS